MLHDTPLRKHIETYAEREAERATDAAVAEARPGAATGRRAVGAAAEFISYGPPDGDGLVACEILATVGVVETEYAALRRGAGLFDGPHRGTLRLRGSERLAFLDRMVTQKLADLTAGAARASFWLNRKGRVEADLLIVELGDETLVDLDVHNAAATRAALDAYLFAEDVALADVTPEIHRISLHGPGAPDVLAAVAGDGAPLAAGEARRVTIAGVGVATARRDQVGAPGIELFVPRDRAVAVWERLVDADEAGAEGRRRVRPVGWYAFNTARIEAGTPLFNVDFGSTNLPHETGVLADRVSFAKGCYLGQEVVARVQNLGKPKQVLVGLRVARDLLPVAGGQVFEKCGDTFGEQVGVVTSSTISPLLGAEPVAFAMIRSSHATPGTTLVVNAEGEQSDAVVGGLRFMPGGADPGSAEP